jgi:hypothetical protein
MLKTIQVFGDGGHAWAKVKRSELIDLNIAQYISVYSYERGEYVYLEEDCDLNSYVDALKNKGIAFKFKEKYSNKSSKIRNYNRYSK